MTAAVQHGAGRARGADTLVTRRLGDVSMVFLGAVDGRRDSQCKREPYQTKTRREQGGTGVGASERHNAQLQRQTEPVDGKDKRPARLARDEAERRLCKHGPRVWRRQRRQGARDELVRAESHAGGAEERRAASGEGTEGRWQWWWWWCRCRDVEVVEVVEVVEDAEAWEDAGRRSFTAVGPVLAVDGSPAEGEQPANRLLCSSTVC